MAQLKEDEWPTDGEPTTSEEEGVQFKRESLNPPTGVHDQQPAGGSNDLQGEESTATAPDDTMPEDSPMRGHKSSRPISY